MQSSGTATSASLKTSLTFSKQLCAVSAPFSGSGIPKIRKHDLWLYCSALYNRFCMSIISERKRTFDCGGETVNEENC